jgi:hypothetical protein
MRYVDLKDVGPRAEVHRSIDPKTNEKLLRALPVPGKHLPARRPEEATGRDRSWVSDLV